MYGISKRVSDGLFATVQGETLAETFENLCSCEEMLRPADKCGMCGAAPKFVVRKNQEDEKFYELHCTNKDCRARLVYGQMKKPKEYLYPKVRWGQLSPSEQEKRGPEPKNKGGWLPHNGWFKYVAPPKEGS